MKIFLSAKLHKATVTEANIHYTGSITIAADLLEAVGIEPYEKVLVVDNTNGNRLETYVIVGEAGSGVICMNGAAAHLIGVGDEITIMTFQVCEKAIAPQVLVLDATNRPLSKVSHASH